MRRVDEVAKKLHGKIGLINAAYNSSDPVERRVARAFLFLGRTVDGGPGSGNFGHQGRPGEIGGSGKGGGKAFRTGSKESGYVGMRKNPVFSGIAEHARANDDYHVFIRHLTSEQKETLKNQHKNCGTKQWKHSVQGEVNGRKGRYALCPSRIRRINQSSFLSMKERDEKAQRA